MSSVSLQSIRKLLVVALVVLGQFSEGFGTTATTTTVRNHSSGSQPPCTPPATSAIAIASASARFPPRGGALSAVASPPTLVAASGPPEPSSATARGSRSRSRSRSVSETARFVSAPGEEAPSGATCPFARFAASFGAVWGSFGVVYILAKAVARVVPIAIEPFLAESALVLSPIQWSLYAASCLFFAYAEGYKGFHKKFAPLVVKRSFTLVIGTAQGNNVWNYLLAPLYSMGLWGATPKRRTVSWGITSGVAGIVALVKKLPAAPRCIIDAGVVVGLTIGSASILYHFFRSVLTGNLPFVDACLPTTSTAK